MKTTVNITLEDIIRRKIVYCQNDTNEELLEMNAGYVRGFKQMLSDINLSEVAFIEKYWGVVKDLKVIFEMQNENKDNIDELSGYNNAIIDVLCLLDEKYLYD